MRSRLLDTGGLFLALAYTSFEKAHDFSGGLWQASGTLGSCSSCLSSARGRGRGACFQGLVGSASRFSSTVPPRARPLRHIGRAATDVHLLKTAKQWCVAARYASTHDHAVGRCVHHCATVTADSSLLYLCSLISVSQSSNE